MSKPKFRQAVLLIHGIGEQRPMSTLRSFVTALVRDDFRSKPDDLSKSFELRRLTYNRKLDEAEHQTCFFEYYWAYRLRDTSYRHVIDWARRLLGTRRRNVPPRLRWVWLFCYITIVFGSLAAIAIILLALQAGKPGLLATGLSLASTVLTVLLGLFSGFVLYQIGDAARYLNSAPANIAERQAIRADGLELLRRLHDAKINGKPKYDRIIVIGHSLGSAIGYDIMKFYWADVHEQLLIKSNSDAARKLKDLIKAGKAVSADSEGNNRISYQEAQEALIGALPSDSPWRIADFITLGSPLTYGDFVLAKSEEELKLRQRQRELPTCPPQEDEDTRGYSFPVENKNGEVIGEILHHAAYFALTRWTNLYFPGDLIGGEVGRLFGSGLVDLECAFPGDPKRSRKFGSHTQYWPRDRRDPLPTSLDKLKTIVLQRG